MGGFPSKAKGNAKGITAKQPRPGIALDKKIMLKLILEEHGNLSRVADRIGSTRHTIKRHCDNDAELGQALEDSRERRIDALERSCWDDAIDQHDTALRCFLLKTQARHRGYDQDDSKNTAKDIAQAAFAFILDKSKNPSST